MKALSNALREKAEAALTDLKHCPNWMFRLVKGLKIEFNDDEGKRYMRGSDSKLCFSEKERGNVCSDCMERIMNEEIIWIMTWKEMQAKVQ